MSSDAKNPVPKIRTYAGDLEQQRGITDTGHETEPEEMIEPANREPVPIASAPKERKAPPPQPEKKVVKENIEVKVPIPKKEKPKKNPKPSKPTKILPFHEIQKQVAAIDKDTASGKRVNVGFDATIITDNKQSSFKFFPALIVSVKTWFKKITKRKKKSENKYTIPETSRRKGVIQKATSKSGSMFTDSDGKLKEQIRRRQQQELEDKINKASAPHEDEPETIWSPYTDTGYDLLEHGEVVQNVQVEYKKKAVEPPAVAIASPAPEVVEEKPIEQLEETETAPQPIEEDQEPDVSLADVPVKLNLKRREDQSLIERMDTNTLAVITLLSIIGIVIIVIVSRILVQYITGNYSGEETQKITAPQAILLNTTIHSITLDNGSASQLPTMLDNAVSLANGNATEIVVVNPLGEEVSPSYIFGVLKLKTVPTLKQSITSVRFIASESGNESILLKFIDETSVRGGMLSWETTMQEDLQTLYEYSDPEEAVFNDSKLLGYDLRVLTLEGKTLLLYSILNENTAIITTSTEDFAQIVQFGLRD